MKVVLLSSRSAPARWLAGALSLWLAVSPMSAFGLGDTPGSAAKSTSSSTQKTSKKSSTHTAASKKSKARKSTHQRRSSIHRRKRRPSAKARRIRRAFVASEELRPMAQQLIAMRTPEAYNGVAAYAHKHTGDAAATAYLALGYAYLLDKKYPDAIANLQHARRAGNALDDYAEYFEVKAEIAADDNKEAAKLVHGFEKRFPSSIFNDQIPELEASAYIGMNDAAAAERVLNAAASTSSARRPGLELARAQVAEKLNQNATAISLYKHLLLTFPLSSEASTASDRLKALGADDTLTFAEMRSLADAYYRAHRYREASSAFHSLAGKSGLDTNTRNSFLVSAADCDRKLNKLSIDDAEALPDTQDENGAHRMYLLMELARDRSDTDTQQAIVSQMETRFPSSPWLAEALFSSGNMYLLKRDYPKAIEYYGYLADHLPANKYAATANWRAGWLNYRLNKVAEASRLFDAQINRYPSANETVSALYWRGRLYETRDHNPAHAVSNYRAIVRTYQHYYYAQLARERLATLGNTQPADTPILDQFQPAAPPELDDSFPEDSEHLAKAKLLANAGLNSYIDDEISADPDSKNWSALAEAQIYASYGETYRALRSLKRALPSAASTPFKSIPYVYWRILFPEPYWTTIKTESAKYNLDPYLVASLIRQESEFNPTVVSYANAYGLMQLLPSVGREMARKEGMRNFRTFQLLDPQINIKLGTRYLRQMIDQFGGVTEYALAAYNAGGSRVADWRDAGTYQGMDEFIESIPFTQTREYVQAILRNIEIYKGLANAGNLSAATTGDRSSLN
ncbi:MAG: transglycosylase SLT domain-containing protein [Acidobacteriota bacterium]|nr:transglycosylase SLT domain-containing protein [Acidobacteriota bacterium]